MVFCMEFLEPNSKYANFFKNHANNHRVFVCSGSNKCLLSSILKVQRVVLSITCKV